MGNPRKRRRITGDAWVLGLLLLTGCVGYQLGSMLPRGLQTVHIPTARNLTPEPLLEDEVTRAIIRACQNDGSLRLADAQTADAVLQVEVEGFELSPLAFDRDMRAQAREYRLTLTAVMALHWRETGEPIVPAQRVSGESTFPFDGDLASAKRIALPEAAEDLARIMITRLVETW